jgi:hypothetical protein
MTYNYSKWWDGRRRNREPCVLPINLWYSLNTDQQPA